jgi:hypothetical protein
MNNEIRITSRPVLNNGQRQQPMVSTVQALDGTLEGA